MTRFLRATLRIVICGGLMAVVSASPVPAQSQEPRPLLGGHRFIWNSFTETPFPTTHVRNLTGGGKFSGVEFVPSYDLGDGITVPALLGDLLFAELEFEYMHQVQPWLGVWGRIGGIGRVGTSSGTLLAQGVTAIFGYELGWLARLYQSDSFILSGVAALSKDDVTDVNMLRWVGGVIDDSGAPLVEAGPRLRGKGGLRAAWGLNESWGFQFKSDLGYGEPSTPGLESEWLGEQGLSISYDLDPSMDVPVGFVLSTALRRSPREGGAPGVRSRDVGLRTAFTGRDNFLIALDTAWNDIDLPAGQDDVALFRAGLSLQLYF